MTLAKSLKGQVRSVREQAVLPSASGRIRELDALRGIAALVVVLHHVFVIFGTEVRIAISGWLYGVLNAIQEQNKGAVLLFFVLSGYAIGLATRGRIPTTTSVLRTYMFQRARRIMPLYYFSLAWTAGLGLVYGLERPSFSFQTLVGNAIFLQTSASAKGTWFVPYGDNGPYWLLSYEVFFYLMLPIVLFCLQKSRFAHCQQAALIWLGILACFFGLLGNVLAPSPISLFLASWVVWLVGYAAVDMKPSRGSVLLLMSPSLMVGAAVLILAMAGRNSDTLTLVFEGTIIAFIFAWIALFPGWTKLAPVKIVRRLMVCLFARIGEGSYALYLLHYPLLLAMHDLLTTPFGYAMWWLSGMGLILFVIPFCPWLERTTGRFLRPSLIHKN